MNVHVLVHPECAAELRSFDADARFAISVKVGLLKRVGFSLGFPHSSSIHGSKHAMRELRVTSNGRPFRVGYAFDPKRDAILLVAGDKTGDDLFYEKFVRIADARFDEHLTQQAEAERQQAAAKRK